MSMIDLSKLVRQAKELGALAFANGLTSIPIHDPKLYQLLEQHWEVNKEFGSCIPILEAWSKAWHKANLAAPVPGL